MKKGFNPPGPWPPDPSEPPDEPGAEKTLAELKEWMYRDGTAREVQIEQAYQLARIATALERLLDGELVVHTRGGR